MRGNIFSIELLIGTVLILSLFTIFYSQEIDTKNDDFSMFNLNTKQINYFYFGEDDLLNSENKICETIVFFNDDTNTINQKQICEEVL